MMDVIRSDARGADVIAILRLIILSVIIAMQQSHAELQSWPASSSEQSADEKLAGVPNALPAERQPGIEQGPVYLKRKVYPAARECGETQVATNNGPVQTPRQGWYVSQCRIITVYGVGGSVLSQREACDPPTFEECS